MGLQRVSGLPACCRSGLAKPKSRPSSYQLPIYWTTRTWNGQFYKATLQSSTISTLRTRPPVRIRPEAPGHMLEVAAGWGTRHRGCDRSRGAWAVCHPPCLSSETPPIDPLPTGPACWATLDGGTGPILLSHPASLDKAVQLAEDNLVAYLRAGKLLPSSPLSLSHQSPVLSP